MKSKATKIIGISVLVAALAVPAVVLAHGWGGGHMMGNRGMGNVTILLPDYADWNGYVFACGPSPMYRAIAKIPELKGKPVQVSLEVRMGCGFGMCYCCAVKTKNGLKQICKDGPVFESESLKKMEDFGKYKRDFTGRKVNL